MLVNVTSMTKQTLGKALKKVNKSLPQSPRKKVAVVKALAKSFQLVTEKKKTGLEIPQETKELVKAFYRREDISRFMPGKQDVVTLLDDDGNKYKEQKRILTMTIAESFNLFSDDHPNVSIGKSKFAELRPKEVLLSSKMPRNVCGRIYHENIILLLNELHKVSPDVFPLYSKEFIDSCVCKAESKTCMSSNCALCKNKFIEVFYNELDPATLRKNCSWYQWEKSEEGRTEKVEKSGVIEELVKLLESKLKKFLFHYFINKQQTIAYNKCKAKATEESSFTAMVQMDFSENFT